MNQFYSSVDGVPSSSPAPLLSYLFLSLCRALISCTTATLSVKPKLSLSRISKFLKIAVHAFILSPKQGCLKSYLKRTQAQLVGVSMHPDQQHTHCFTVSLVSSSSLNYGPYFSIPFSFFCSSCYCMSRKPFPFLDLYYCYQPVTSKLLADRLWCLHVHICSSAGSDASWLLV